MDNERLEQTINSANRQLVRYRQDHVNAKDELNSFGDEVEVARNQMSASEVQKTNTKNELTVLQKNLRLREEKLKQLEKNHAQQTRALENIVSNTKEKGKQSEEADKSHMEAIQNLRQVEKELKTAKDGHFKEIQELYKLRAEEAGTLGEISGARSAIKNLHFTIGKLDLERQRQQELLYAVDFQSQLMQRKVARVSGERTQEEREEHNKKLDALNKRLEDQKKLHAKLAPQVKRQEAELKTANRAHASIKKEADILRGEMEELELSNVVTNRAVQATVKQKEEALMEHDLLKLEVKKVRQQLNTKSESVFSLENRKHQLQISMQEQEKEIEVQQTELKLQLRGAEEERHKAVIELAERKQKIYRLRMKYENVSGKVKKEDGEEQGQAYYVIKAAQEKEELQRKGDELDDEIRKAEREIRALENTLGHLLTRNKKYKENFQMANQQSQNEIEEKRMLEEQSLAANDVLFKNKKTLRRLEDDLRVDFDRYHEIQVNLEGLQDQSQQLTAARDAIQYDLDSLKPKLDRARQALEVSRRKAMNAGIDLGPDSLSMVENETKNLKDNNLCVLYALENALQDHPDDVLPFFHNLCTLQGVTPPTRPPSIMGSRPPSGRAQVA